MAEEELTYLNSESLKSAVESLLVVATEDFSLERLLAVGASLHTQLTINW